VGRVPAVLSPQYHSHSGCPCNRLGSHVGPSEGGAPSPEAFWDGAREQGSSLSEEAKWPRRGIEEEFMGQEESGNKGEGK
jgi:hypothetical protein